MNYEHFKLAPWPLPANQASSMHQIRYYYCGLWAPVAATASYGSPRLSRKTIGRKICGVCVGGYVISDCRTSPPAWVSRTFRGYPADSLDVAILVHTRVGIVDAFAPTSEHGTPPSVLQCELQPLGYREISLDRLEGSNAYLAIFAPPSVASRTRPEAIVACKSQ